MNSGGEGGGEAPVSRGVRGAEPPAYFGGCGVRSPLRREGRGINLVLLGTTWYYLVLLGTTAAHTL
jgi:hypothetical protein